MNNPLPFDKLRIFKVLKWVAGGESDVISAENGFDVEETTSLETADVVSSELRESDPFFGKRHMLVIDLDVSAALIPSSTPGHSHLFIDAPMSWLEYQDVLEALANAGILEAGYVGASKARGFTAVRLPWVRKTQDPWAVKEAF